MKKTAIVLTLCLLCVALAATAVFYPAGNAAADEIKIYPDETSQYAAFGDAIAYTTNKNELVLSTENGSFTLSSAYSGRCRSIAMNGKYVFLLTVVQNESSEVTSFTAYEYSPDTISIKNGINALSLFGNVTSAEISSNLFMVTETTISGVRMGGYDLLYLSGDMLYCMSRSDSPNTSGYLPNDFIYFGNLSTGEWNRTAISVKDFATATDFVISENTIYFNAENKLYYTDDISPQPEKYLGCDKNFHSLAYADGIIYALSDDGIFAVNPSGFAYKKLSSDSYDGKIRILDGDDETYLLAQDVSGKCIKQYVINGSSYESVSLTYFNVFDGVIYQDPTTYDLVRVGKATRDTQAYFSPKNLKTEFSLTSGEYVLALAKQDGYYYVRNEAGDVAYVNESDLTLLSASEDTAVGKYGQAMHDNTSVYLYPYESDDVVATVGIDDLLIVVDNVAEDGGNHVWGWYKVCIVGEDGTLTYGYLQKEYLSKYTNFKLPSFSTDATVSAGSLGGIINVYLLPDEESEVLGSLTDGDKVTLAQEKLDSSEEWTKIVYNDMMGYVKTANLITKGITPLQITLIVVFSVVIVATAIVIVLVVKKRNAQRFDY